MKIFRILVTGSRDWTDYNAVARKLAIQFSEARTRGYDKVIVRHGACRYEDPSNPGDFIGADEFAQEFTNKCMGAIADLELILDPRPANWKKYGKPAGPIRNKEMVDLGADICLAFIKNYSHGSTGCARLSEQAGIPVDYTRR